MIHRHVYKLIANYGVEPPGITYQDWQCTRSNCPKIIRRYFSSPPTRRVESPAEPQTIQIEKGPTVFGASDA